MGKNMNKVGKKAAKSSGEKIGFLADAGHRFAARFELDPVELRLEIDRRDIEPEFDRLP